uniref:non-specific serine/threonine protein kinase n=1 Tax=Macrostomum lignano TaxID=282301 RepID=A0A1I8FQ17_9PLAT
MRSGQVKLGDFGVAKTLDCTLATGQQLPSAHTYYVSPEIVKSRGLQYIKPTSGRSAACCHELLTLNHAFEAKNEKQLYINIKLGNVMPVSPRYSSEIRSICSAMFRKNPRDRPTVQALLEEGGFSLPALLKHISAEAPALRFSASFRLAFQEVAAIQQASPASAGQKRPGSAPRPSSASSKRAVAAAAAAYPAAPLSPYAQKLGGGGGGGNESASLGRSRRDARPGAASGRGAPRQRAAQAADAAAAAEGTRAGRSKTPPAALDKTRPKRRRRLQLQQLLLRLHRHRRPRREAEITPHTTPRWIIWPRRRSTGRVSRRSRSSSSSIQGLPFRRPRRQLLRHHARRDNQSERAQRLLEDYWERKRLAARIKAQGLGLGAAQAVNPLSPRPAAVAVEETYLRRLEEVRRRNQRERQQLGRFQTGASPRQHPRTPATEMIRKLRRDERRSPSCGTSIARASRRQVPQQQPPPPDAGVRSAWDSVDSDVDRLDRLPLRVGFVLSLRRFSYIATGADGGAEQCARQTPRAWGARADDTGFLRRLGNAPILSGTLAAEQEVDGEGEVDGKADSESVKSPAHSDLSQVETAEASAAAATAAAAVAKLKQWRRLVELNTLLWSPSSLVESSPSISDASASTGHSLLDQVAFEPDAERPQKEASANSVDNEKPGKSGATAGKGGVDLERTDMQLAIYQSLKDFALSAATTAAATDDEVEAAEQLLLSSLTLEEAEELAEVERSFHRVLNDPEPSPSDAKDDDTKAEADDA